MQQGFVLPPPLIIYFVRFIIIIKCITQIFDKFQTISPISLHTQPTHFNYLSTILSTNPKPQRRLIFPVHKTGFNQSCVVNFSETNSNGCSRLPPIPPTRRNKLLVTILLQFGNYFTLVWELIYFILVTILYQFLDLIKLIISPIRAGRE